MASEKTKEGLPPAGGGGAGFMSAETYEKIRKLLAYADLVPDPAQFEVIERAGKKHFRYRTGQDPAPGPGGGGGSGGGDSFCEFYEESGDWYIRGGPVQCGIKNFNVEPFEVATGTDGQKLIYIEATVEAYRTDEGDYFLPGIKTSSETTLIMEDTAAADYPSNTDPTIALLGVGTVIFPVGVVTVASGVPTFAPTNCGGFRATQCAGSLTYERF